MLDTLYFLAYISFAAGACLAFLGVINIAWEDTLSPEQPTDQHLAPHAIKIILGVLLFTYGLVSGALLEDKVQGESESNIAMSATSEPANVSIDIA